VKYDEAKALAELYRDSLTEEYKRQLIWWLDRKKPDIADRVRAMVKTDLVRTID
jgi:hypothetical protein